MSIPRRRLSKSGPEVSCIGLGCMGMSWAYGPPEESEAVKTLHRAIEIGVDFLDTAEIYGPYKNEELLGRALKGKRDQVFIATKFGFHISEDGSIRGANSRPQHIKQAVEGSLKRLNTDVIDLYYQHRVDKAVPIEETVGAMADLVRAGKVRYLGLSEAGPETLRRANRTHEIVALQSEYSMWERGIEEEILPVARELNIALVAYSPVGRGFLTGQLKNFEDLAADDYRRQDPRYQGANFDKNLQLVDAVNVIARKHGCTAAQVAIAWLLQRGNDIIPIPGTKRVSYLEENSNAWQFHLDAEDLREIDALAQKTSGARYDEIRMQMIER
jgi:aryl-alcohol dehydrogenase-like predicted oxidoreductase